MIFCKLEKSIASQLHMTLELFDQEQFHFEELLDLVTNDFDDEEFVNYHMWLFKRNTMVYWTNN